MSPILRALIPALVLAAATPALAQTPPDATAPGAAPVRPPRAFIAADIDHDGKLSFEEYKAMIARFQARRAAQHPDSAAQPAKLTPEQQDARLHKRFDRIDTDHDGYIEPAEWLAWRARMRAAQAARRGLPAQAAHTRATPDATTPAPIPADPAVPVQAAPNP